MRTASTLLFSFGSEKKARSLFRILDPEVKSDSRVETKLSHQGSKVRLSLSAGDRNAFRSALNSYAMWIRLYEEIGGIK
jgi:tRNA threonylcarbamoyladenosine modification (KEOPS) complex  Pcc1 subunit